MAKITGYDFTAWDLTHRAERDPKAARETLAYAAKQIKEGKVLIDPLRKWIAEAFEDAAAKRSGKEATAALGRKLRLKAFNRRMKADPVLVAYRIHCLVGRRKHGGMNVEEAVEIIAKEEGIGESTAKRYYLKNKKAVAEADMIRHED